MPVGRSTILEPALTEGWHPPRVFNCDKNEWSDCAARGFKVDYMVTNPATGKLVYRNKVDFENVTGQSFTKTNVKDFPRG